MKYQAPYGSSDINAPYINGNPQVGVRGSIPPAPAFEQPMRELVACIANSGQTPSDTDLAQLWKAMQIAGWIQNYAVDTGTANAYACALSPVPTQYYPGMIVRIKIAHDNSGTAGSTINVNALGAIAVVHADGAALVAGDFKSGQVAELVFDGTHFQVVNFLGQPGTGGGGGGTTNNYTLAIPFAVVTGLNSLVGTFAPTITALSAGNPVLIKNTTANTGAVTLTCDAMSAKQLVWPNGNQLAANDILAGAVILAVYDGSKFQALTITNPITSGAFGPPGTYVYLPYETVPSGLLECDGASYGTATYPNLFAKIGYTYGGSGSSFKVPDVRGMFLRCWAHGSSGDPDRASRLDRGDGTGGDRVGTRQGDQNQVHSHGLNGGSAQVIDYAVGGLGAGGGQDSTTPLRFLSDLTTGNSGGNEARPRNVNAMVCIAY